MIELVIHGRGGRGGITLAKLVAGAHFRRGLHAQAFGVYGPERTGAPVQAFVRIDSTEIGIYNSITAPNHVVILEPSLIASEPAAGMRANGWLVINTPQPPEALAEVFPGRNVATVDANTIAVAQRLGSAALPIVNTAMLGAVARVLGLAVADVEGTLAEAGFVGANLVAAREAFEQVETAIEPGPATEATEAQAAPSLSFLDARVGNRPATRTGSWASRRPHVRELRSLCNEGCPAGNNVRSFVRAAAAGDYDSALAILLETSPFPGTCGRVCPSPCVSACNRRELDAAVNVRDIERAVADRGRWPSAVRAADGQRPVAIVGSGPAGLSAAYHLARLGHPVTVFEAGKVAGGVLRTGIPEYRLPRSVLDREIDFIVGHGVEVRTGRRVNREALVELTKDYAAVLVATGLQELRVLELLGDANGTVGQGLEFLYAARNGAVDLAGQSVVVVGGGNTAIDAARTALRFGADEVRVAYRRTRAEMPAMAEEIEEALEEGVLIEELLTPTSLRQKDGKTLLVCSRMRLGEPDESGRPRPVPADGDAAAVSLRCDRLLLALGQGGDLSLLPDSAPPCSGPLTIAEESAPIFLGGDVANAEGTVAAAIGSGRRAALAIHAALTSGSGTSTDIAAREHALGSRAGDVTADEVADVTEFARPDVMRLNAFSCVPQESVALLPADMRRRTFAEVRQGLVGRPDRDAARAEAQRCLACGACTGCDTCVVYCPEGVLQRVDGQTPEFDYDYCKGCGLCASACPRGVVFTEAI